MIVDVRRLRPTRGTFAALGGLLVAISFGAARDFVWADLRDGLVSLRGLSRVTRSLIWIGFALLLAMVAALLFNDLWRAHAVLIPLPNSGLATAGRGSLLPEALVPATLFMLAVAWAFGLTGALHAHPAARILALLVYLPLALNQLLTTALSAIGDFGGALDLLGVLAALATLLAIPLVFALRWRARPRPGAEFLILLLCVSTSLAVAQRREVIDFRTMGVPLGLADLQYRVMSLGSLISPLLLFIGVDIAGFASRSSGWVTAIVTQRLPRWLSPLLLVGYLGWRLRTIVVDLSTALRQSTPEETAWAYAGAMGVPLLAAAVWWLVARDRRRAGSPGPVEEYRGQAAGDAGRAGATAVDVEAACGRHGLPLILAYYAPAMLVFLLMTVAVAFLPFPGIVLSLTGFSHLVNGQITTWYLVVDAGAAILAAWLAYSGRRSAALYLGIFAALALWTELTNPGRPLSRLLWRGPEPVDAWWVALFGLISLFWLLRHELTSQRAGRLLFLLLASDLLRQTGFISSPFKPILGFTGVGLVAFGILWDSLTAGSWANADTRALPRTSRILMYLGYILLTATVLNWALTSHDLFDLGQYTGSMALVGLERFGKPMLYGVFIATLAAPATARAAWEADPLPE